MPFFWATKTWPSGAKRTAVGFVRPLKTTESVNAGSTTVAAAVELAGVRMPGGLGLPAPAAPASARQALAAIAASAAIPTQCGARRGSSHGTVTIGSPPPLVVGWRRTEPRHQPTCPSIPEAVCANCAKYRD